jgi:hypothetical protein
MVNDKNLQFCMQQLRCMLDRDGLEPEQRSALENVERQLRRLWRVPSPSRREIFRIVRNVAEAIIKNFVD